MKYYKCLRENRTSWYDESFQWPYRKLCKVPQAENGGACGVGLHLAKTIDSAIFYGKFPCSIWEVEPKSPILGEDDDKIRVATALLGKKIHLDYIEETNKYIKSIADIKWFANQKPLEHWQLFDNRAAARGAARAAARAAAWDAARDASLVARIKICTGIKLSKKHTKHAEDRWEVWKRGYGLFCDIEGKFFVYKKI